MVILSTLLIILSLLEATHVFYIQEKHETWKSDRL